MRDKTKADNETTSASESPNNPVATADAYPPELARAVFTIHGYAILTLDVDGRVTTWNAGAESTTGYESHEILGQTFSIFYSEADRAIGAPQRALEKAAHAGRFDEEGWRLRKSGDRFWASVLIEPIKDANGTIAGYTKITRDISERRQFERVREEFSQIQKLEIVSQLTGGVAHDFNNLLTAVEAGYALIQNYTSDVRIARILDVSKVPLERARRLLSQLVAFSRKQILASKTSNINELIMVFENLLRSAVDASIELKFDLRYQLASVEVDQGQFQSSLLNLVVNARDALSKGGTIRIFTDEVTLSDDNFREPVDLPAGNYVVLGVSDDGCGMSRAVRDRATEPFFTTKPVGKGIGLGLSQTFGFARQSEGTLSIDTEENRGTTVRLFLPVSSDVTEAGLVMNKTILLVDDDETVRTLASEMLRMLGHTVYEAEDAIDALNQLQRNIEINCVFSDVVMPGMSGIELIAAVRKMRPGIQGILASGYSRDHLREISTLPDNVSFLQKPYTASILQSMFTPNQKH